MRRDLSTGPRWMLAALVVLVAYGCTPRGQGFCVFTPNFGFQQVDVPGAASTHPRGVRNLGPTLDPTVVGFYVDANRGVHGFRREPNGTITTIDAPGARETRLLGINNNGQMSGNFLDGSGNTIGFILAPGGNPAPMGSDPVMPDAWSINDDNMVAGTMSDTSGRNRGFVYPPGFAGEKDGWRGTILVGNSFPTRLYGINNTRRMTGAMQDSSAGPFKAFYLSGPDIASFQAIPLSDVTESAAYGINNAALPQCVDHVGTYRRSGHDHGFLHWGSNLRDVDASIGGVTVTDTRVYAISDEWQLVGEYVDGGGALHGFIATPQ